MCTSNKLYNYILINVKNKLTKNVFFLESGAKNLKQKFEWKALTCDLSGYRQNFFFNIVQKSMNFE